MGTITLMEQRRQRGLVELASLLVLRETRPLHACEERWLEKASSLVREMDERIQAQMPGTLRGLDFGGPRSPLG